MQVVVNEPGRVLQVEAFRQYVGRNQNACFGQSLRFKTSARRTIVVGRELRDDFAPVAFRGTIDLVHFLDTALLKLVA